MSRAYTRIRVKEVRGQVPGTTCNGVRTNNAINNKQASSYIRREAPVLRHQAPRAIDRTTAVLRRHLLASHFLTGLISLFWGLLCAHLAHAGSRVSVPSVQGALHGVVDADPRVQAGA